MKQPAGEKLWRTIELSKSAVQRLAQTCNVVQKLQNKTKYPPLSKPSQTTNESLFGVKIDFFFL